MPANLTIGLFVLGSVLLLVGLLGGRFKIFGAEVSTQAGTTARFVATIFGLILLVPLVISWQQSSHVAEPRDDRAPGPSAAPTSERAGETRPPGAGPKLPAESPAFVKIPGRSYSLSKDEISQAQFAEFVADAKVPISSSGCWGQPLRDGSKGPDRDWRFPQKGGRYPVVCITHAEAEAYAHWLGLQLHATVRLPTHEEWEYAASGGGRKAYGWGNDWPPPSRVANIADETAWTLLDHSGLSPLLGYADGYEYSAPIGSFTSDEYGLNDMTGNVYEWVAECGQNDCYVRGGSWDSGAQKNLRVDWRQSAAPGGRYSATGFRVLQE